MTNQPTRCAQLRQLLHSPQLEFLLEAHNGISAHIVEQAGFRGIWASGLAISAQFGVRDSNEASWTQVVDVLEFMSDVTRIPILLDGDTGYGNFNNMRRLVRKLEQRQVAGVCIEDKQFPKTNSFIDGEKQPLADVDEFCGKIKAGKDVQTDTDFCIIARVEALIAGWSMAEALRRADAYRAAGADGILIHSKLSRPDEILEFAQEWADRAPLIIVPTKYFSTPTEVFRRARISIAIWANHMLRAAVEHMEQVSAHIKTQESVADVEHRIATINHIFELQGAAELSAAQDRYLKPAARTQAIVLAASRGNALRELTEDRPKVMISVGGKSLLQRLAEEFKRQAIGRVVVVAGYKAETIDVGGVEVVQNPDYATTGELTSLECATTRFEDDMVILYGDLLFRSYILRDLLDSPGELVVVVDSALEGSHKSGTPDLAFCSRADDRSLFREPVRLLRIDEKSRSSAGEIPSGHWIGMLRARAQGRQWIAQALAELHNHGGLAQLTIPDLLNHLIRTGREVQVHYIHGHWLDVNQLDDLDRAGDFAQGHS